MISGAKAPVAFRITVSPPSTGSSRTRGTASRARYPAANERERGPTPTLPPRFEGGQRLYKYEAVGCAADPVRRFGIELTFGVPMRL
jgi:hypothetical protein